MLSMMPNKPLSKLDPESITETLPTEYESLRDKTRSIIEERDRLRLRNEELNGKLEEAYSMMDDISVETEYDIRGQLSRKVWLAENKLKTVEKELEENEVLYEIKVRERDQCLEAEREVSHSLRQRIGKLEERIRSKHAESERWEKECELLEKRIESEQDRSGGEIRKLKTNVEDLSDSLGRERRKSTILSDENRDLKEKLTQSEKALALEVVNRSSTRR